MRLITVFLLFFTTLTFAQTYTVATVPNTKVVANSYVSDPDHLIHDTTIVAINNMLLDIEQKSTAQVSVVLLTSIGDASEFDFAQELFKTWGIGKAAKDNGLLILYVRDKKVIRFHTGFGLEGVLTDAVCKQIQTRFMVPYFREGNVDRAMIAGIDEVSKLVNNPSYQKEIRDESSAVYRTDTSDQAAL